jgi:hypothetical protein
VVFLLSRLDCWLSHIVHFLRATAGSQVNGISLPQAANGRWVGVFGRLWADAPCRPEPAARERLLRQSKRSLCEATVNIFFVHACLHRPCSSRIE